MIIENVSLVMYSKKNNWKTILNYLKKGVLYKILLYILFVVIMGMGPDPTSAWIPSQ